MAGHYGGNPYRWFGGPNNPHICRYFVTRGWIMPGETVLDAGCGSGYGTHMISQIAGKAIGYDVDSSAIQGARSNWPSSNTEFEVKDLNECGLPEVDVTISIECVEHLNNMYHFIREAKRKTKRLIVICVPLGGTSHEYVNEPPGPSTEKNDFMDEGDVDKLVIDDVWKIQTGYRYGYSYIGIYYRKEPEDGRVKS